MTPTEDSLAYLVEQIGSKAPELLTLISDCSDEDFDSALETYIEKTLRQLESQSQTFSTLDEVTLTRIVSMGLNVPFLHVTCEESTNGHVDITIVVSGSSPIRKRLGEAKIYRGPSYHINGIEQLVSRYSTGRDPSGFMISYVQQKGIKQLVRKIRDRMDKEKPCNQLGATEDGRIVWAFFSSHEHSSGEELMIYHYSCNLHRETN